MHAHLPILFHLAAMVLCHPISYAVFHFPRGISIEQRFFPYILEGQLTRRTIIYLLEPVAILLLGVLTW